MALVFRKLQKEDFSKGFLQLLGQLTTVGSVSREQFEAHFDARESNPDMHTLVGTIDGAIACTASLLIESKYVHGCSQVGHIEDVVVDRFFKRRGYGKQIITELVRIAKQSNCYKVILDCNNENVPFYESCGLSKHSNEMALYF
jgi:glucosamine-phosphate N-acetyltransferase